MTAIQDIQVHAPLVFAQGACFLVICTIMVALRFYARYLSSSRWGLDDLCIGIALVCVCTGCITLIAETAVKGIGYSEAEGHPDPGADANLGSWPLEIIQIPALGFIKLTFLFLYRRIFTSHVTKRFSVVNWVMISIVIMWTVGYLFLFLFFCKGHPASYWTSSETEQTECLSTYDVHLGYAISDAITDVLCILVPIPEIWKLNLPARQKWAVTGVFGLGAITCAMSIIRMVIYYEALTVQFDPDTDFEYITTLTSYFSMFEAGLGICAACLPVQYGLMRNERFRRVFRSMQSMGSRSGGGTKSSNVMSSQVSGMELRSRQPGVCSCGAGCDGERGGADDRRIYITKSFDAASGDSGPYRAPSREQPHAW